MSEDDDPLIVAVIGKAALAGAYLYWARREPDAARGLMKAHAKAHRETRGLLAAVVERAEHEARKG